MLQWMNRNKLLLMPLGLAILFGVSAYLYTSSTLRAVNSGEQTQPVEEKTESPFFCPLDGAPLEALPEQRPLAVVLDNLSEARPQSGLAQADIVYEMPVEGGITRLMAVYYHGQADRVGPIRSARPYLIQQAMELGAVVIHSGGSPQALSYFKEHNAAHIDEYNTPGGFWRAADRKAPHNLYANTEELHQLADGLDLGPANVPALPFLKEGQALPEWLEKAETTEEVEIFFAYQPNIVKYIFDQTTNSYARYSGGEPHDEGETGLQLQAKNIIVQFVETKVVDGAGRLDVGLTGHGHALIFTSGRVYEANWRNDGSGGPPTFSEVGGNPLVLQPGQTWVEVVPSTTKVIF